MNDINQAQPTEDYDHSEIAAAKQIELQTPDWSQAQLFSNAANLESRAQLV